MKVEVIETTDAAINAVPGLTLRYEQGVFNVATKITEAAYTGGVWRLKKLSNGGFFMAYTGDETFTCVNPAAFYQGEFSGDLFSVAVNMYVSSVLSFYYHERGDDKNMEAVGRNYHALREFAFGDDSPFSSDEIGALLRLID